MTNISYNTGVKEYVINGDETKIIRVNVTDVNIMSRFNEANEVIQNLTVPSEKKYSIEDAARIDQEIRKQINYIFGTDISTPAFGETNCLSPVTDGRPLFQAFLEAFLPQVKKDIESVMTVAKINLGSLEQKAEKYTSQLSPEPDRNKLINPAFNTKPGIDLTPEQKMFLKSLLENE